MVSEVDLDTLVWRPAVQEDQDAIRGLLRLRDVARILRHNPDKMLHNSLKRSNYFLFVKEVDGQFAGITYIVMDGANAEVYSANMPDYRGVGIGHLVVPQIEQFLREENVEHVFVRAEKRFPGAVAVDRLFTSMGWRHEDGPQFITYSKDLT